MLETGGKASEMKGRHDTETMETGAGRKGSERDQEQWRTLMRRRGEANVTEK